MPAFGPRTKEEILQSLVMRMVAQSQLSDLRENSEFTTLLGVVAEQLEAAEYRVEEFHAAHHFEGVSGSLARDRVGQLPNGGLGGMLPESPATGRVLVLTRASAVGAVTVAAASVLVGRSDAPGVVYQLAEDAVFADGALVAGGAGAPLRVVCLTAGEAGNCPIGAIDRVVQGPQELVEAANVDALTNGQPAESVAQYVKRAEAYLASLAGRPQEKPLEYLGTTFRSSSGVRARHARVVRDARRPGYAELVVDDGYGFAGFTRAGRATSGVVPVSGQRELWFESPAATTPEVWVGGRKLVAQYGVEPDWRVEHELGRVVFREESALLVPGVSWEVKNYQVFTDFVAELQAVVLGATEDVNEPGWVSSGNRLRVVPPRGQDLGVHVVVWLASGWRLEDVAPVVQAMAVAHVATLAADEAFRPFRLYAELGRVAGVEDVEIKTPEGPQWPVAGRRWVTRAALVRVTNGG